MAMLLGQFIFMVDQSIGSHSILARTHLVVGGGIASGATLRLDP